MPGRAMTQLGRIEAEDRPGLRLLRMVGDVDLSNAASLSSELQAAIANDPPTVVIDLTETGYLDSMGVELLFRLAERLHGRRHRLHLVIPPGVPVRSVIELTGLSDLVPVWEALADVPAEPGDRSA